jgi:hypothetical protein
MYVPIHKLQALTISLTVLGMQRGYIPFSSPPTDHKWWRIASESSGWGSVSEKAFCSLVLLIVRGKEALEKMKPRYVKLVRALVMSFLVSTLLPCLSGWLSTCPRAHAYSDIPIKPVPFVCFDLYTQKGGAGPGVPGGNFEPGEDVILYAKMTINDSPAVNTTILFVIEGPASFNLSVSIVPTAVTNSSGIASHTFHIQPINNAPDTVLGTWSVTAQTGLDQATFGDSLDFQVAPDPLPVVPEFQTWTIALLLSALAVTLAHTGFRMRLK